MLELNIHWALSIPRKLKQTKRVQDSPTVKNAFGIRLLGPPRPQGPSRFTASGVGFPHVVEKIISTEMYLVVYNQKKKKSPVFKWVFSFARQYRIQNYIKQLCFFSSELLT